MKKFLIKAFYLLLPIILGSIVGLIIFRRLSISPICEIPASKIKIEIARILKDEGFINDYKIKKNNVQDIIVISLKYGDKKERVMS